MEQFVITPEFFFTCLGLPIICIIIGLFSEKSQKICQAVIIGCVCALFVAYLAVETNSSFPEAVVGTAIFFGIIALIAYLGSKWHERKNS